jgi:hypothetical protein
MGLGVLTPVLEWVQQLRIKTCQASQILGIDLICLLLVGVDEPQFAGIGHKDLVAAFFEHPAHPRRMSSRLYCDSHGPLGGEAPPEGFGGGTQPTIFEGLAALCVDETQG